MADASSNAAPSFADPLLGEANQRKLALDKWRPARKPCVRRVKKRIALALAKQAELASTPPLPRLGRISTATLFLADGLFKMYAAWGFLLKGDWCWAVCTGWCYMSPLCLFYILQNGWTKPSAAAHRRERYRSLFGSPPTVAKVCLMHYRMLLQNWVDSWRPQSKLSPERQTHVKLQATLSLLEQMLFILLLIWVYYRETGLGRNPPSPLHLLPAVASALLNAYFAYSYLRTYARLQTGGNVSEFMGLLISFGEGAAPPMLLKRLRNERDVIVYEDLSSLSFQGMKSVGKAIEGSLSIVSCKFSVSARLEENNEKMSERGLGEFLEDMAGNRALLRSITFETPIYWTEEFVAVMKNVATALDEVYNGEEKVLNQDEEDPILDLRRAIDAGDIERVKAVLDSRKTVVFDTTGTCNLGVAVLMANRLGSWEALAQLLVNGESQLRDRLGGDLNVFRSDLLEAAVTRGHLECAELLIFWGAPVDKPGGFCGEDDFPIKFAAKYGHCEILQLLLEKRASVNSQNPNHREGTGTTALHWCKDERSIASALLAAGADVNVPDSCNGTPLWYCCLYNKPKVATLLINARADLEITAEGSTCLQQAAMLDSSEVVRLLVDARADVTAKDGDGRTAKDLAEAAGSTLSLGFLS